MKKASKAELKLLETMFAGIIASGTNPRLILCALHNTCVHGEKLKDAGWEVTDDNLLKLYGGFEQSLAAFKSMGC